MLTGKNSFTIQRNPTVLIRHQRLVATTLYVLSMIRMECRQLLPTIRIIMDRINFPEKLIPLFINNIRHRKPLPVYGKGENVRNWLYVVDYDSAIDTVFHHGKTAETYNIGGFNEWKNIDIIEVVIKMADRLLGRLEDANMDTYVTDLKGHDMRYAIDSSKLKREFGWEPSLLFEGD